MICVRLIMPCLVALGCETFTLQPVCVFQARSRQFRWWILNCNMPCQYMKKRDKQSRSLRPQYDDGAALTRSCLWKRRQLDRRDVKFSGLFIGCPRPWSSRAPRENLIHFCFYHRTKRLDKDISIYDDRDEAKFWWMKPRPDDDEERGSEPNLKLWIVWRKLELSESLTKVVRWNKLT